MSTVASIGRAILSWFDADRGSISSTVAQRSTTAVVRDGVDWWRIIPFIALHVACAAVVWVGVSPVAVLVAVVSYLLRMFAITAFYHRYFSHKAFTTGRVTQFCFAVLGAAATQRGPLWWAAHHRNHHRFADTPRDPHRPEDGLLWAHMGWFLSPRHFGTDTSRVRDWMKFPELVWLNRFDTLVPVAYAAVLFLLGEWLADTAPELGADG